MADEEVEDDDVVDEVELDVELVIGGRLEDGEEIGGGTPSQEPNAERHPMPQ